MRRRSDNALVFMVKWPEPGRAKTRLCPPLTTTEAAGLARCFLLDMLTEARQVEADLWLAFAPLAAGPRFRRLVGADAGLIPAETPDFGEALLQAQRGALAMGYRRVALVGSDLPHLPASRYAEAFATLESATAVIGPSGDGGYYLLASRHETPALFRDVRWSTEMVFRQTLDRASAAGISMGVIASCDDIDTPADLTNLTIELSESGRGRETLALLRTLPLAAGVAAD